VEGFQVAGISDLHVPYDVAIPAKATSQIVVSGNLSADAALSTPRVQESTSNIAYTCDSGTAAAAGTEIDQLDQFSGGSESDGQLGIGESGTIAISGYNPDGTELSSGLTFAVNPDTTLGGLIDHLNNNVLTGATASLVNGKIQITDNESGYSKSDITLSYSGDGLLKVPGYFEVSAVGGEEIKTINIAAYDSQGAKHILSGAFVRTDTPNVWDMVLTSITGNVHQITMEGRRIEGITFDPGDGSYAGLSGSDLAQFAITFEHDTSSPQTVQLNLGTPGKLDGLTQFAGNSTAVAREQDGYGAGRLATVSVNNEGILIGAFSNGIKKNIATIQISLFQNTAGLESVGGGYFIPSANSGEAVATQARTGGAGTVHGGALEKSNADVATEFVNMIQAQNGFQANARTIKVANDILSELSNLIR
jgi:flagellar hook protein FlgE